MAQGPGQLMSMGVIEPQARLKQLASHANSIVVNSNIPIHRYYRSGMEMVKMANVYLSEGNTESAYILYMKFMILFLEKIQAHSEYKTVPTTERKPIKEKLNQILPLTEKLKINLLERYQKEYTKFLAEKEKEKLREARLADENKKRQGSTLADDIANLQVNLREDVTPTAPNLNDVVYPNDFPSGTAKSSVPSTGLLLPDSDKKTPKPIFDRSLKPSASLMDDSLRTVVIPSDTMTQFLTLAFSNTNSNIETCGILAGRLEYNRLLITHVIVPKQKGTSDSCTATNEEDLFAFQDTHNLITFGWIHTHPTQTAFLSSVDLHTHCSYQLMLPEAVAIVCAPKYQTTGFFCLTPNYGLDFIAQCRQTGFHPHPADPPLFMDAAHIFIDRSLHADIIDLRR